MKRIILILLIILAGFTTQAQEKKNKNAKVDIAVKGNCDQCKKRIEKAAYAVSGVKQAQWDEGGQALHLILDESKGSADKVRAAVANAGHDTDKVKATDEAYNNLHSCCQYNRG